MRICIKPARGLATILLCPNATRAMVFQRSLGLSDKSKSLPRLIFPLISAILRMKITAVATKSTVKMMLEIMCVILYDLSFSA